MPATARPGERFERSAELPPLVIVFRQQRRVPAFHAAEMRSARVGIANPLYDREAALLYLTGDAVHGWVQAVMVAQLQHAVSRDAQLSAVLEISVVCKRNDGVDAVV